MRKKLVINDLHIGAKRSAGTTPQTALDLRLWLLGQVRALMMQHLDKDIIVNGDLFDAFEIPMGDALAFFEICADWMEASAGVESHRIAGDAPVEALGGPPGIAFGRGNHDVSKDSSRLSMFDFFCAVMKAQFPERVRVITEPTLLWKGFYMIPHAVNQEEFDRWLKAAEKLSGPCYVFLHANFDNNFATQSDHSLNVSREQAQRLTERQLHLIFGHEHQQKNDRGVTVVGNQFPTSVVDCLGNDSKKCLVIDPKTMGREEIETWRVPASFYRIDWRTISDTIWTSDALEFGQFIRVEGEASAEEAAHVIAAHSKLRQKSDAFVVTNAVRVEGVDAVEDIQVTAEEMRGVDVLNYLMEQLEPEQVVVVKRLLQEAE